MPKTFKHLYPQIYQFENLYQAFRQARRGGKRKSRIVIRREQGVEVAPSTRRLADLNPRIFDIEIDNTTRRIRGDSMSKSYSVETHKILDDFLEALSENEQIDAAFIAELRQMTNAGELDNRTRISTALAILEKRADELQD